MVPKHKELKTLKDQLKQEIKHQRQHSNSGIKGVLSTREKIHDPTTNPST